VNKLRDAEFCKAVGFDGPTQLPRDEAQHRDWQAANREWWEARPMRYDWREDVAATPGTLEYFREVDKRFLSAARSYMPWQTMPFDKIIPFERLRDRDVLEIGVGQGTHAQLLAGRCRSFVGVDLTTHATRMTRRRLQLMKLRGSIVRMDAETMAFADASFDYVWSWGVIHHSADTGRLLREMHRVLRHNGECAVMVYYRSWWHFYTCGFLRGIFQGRFRERGSLHHVTQGATDGAIARYYSQTAWRQAVNGLFAVERVQVFGQKAEIVPIPGGRLKSALESLVPDGLARVMTNALHMGSFLVAQMRKI